MSGLVVFLVAITLADLTAGGLGGDPPVGRRRWIAPTVGTLTGAGLAAGLAVPLWEIVPVLGIALFLWILLRGQGDSGTVASTGSSELRAWAALAALGCGLAGTLILAARWQGAPPDLLVESLHHSPFSRLRSTDPLGGLLVLAIGLFLTAPANAVVRLGLQIAGTDTQRSEQRLRGGRIIGILERWMIFGLALTGELTAAALVVSAKSLLRFPEISRSGLEPPENGRVAEVDAVTEYFLLGSLLSWTLALAPVLLLS